MAAAVVAVVAGAATGCKQRPADLREWRPSDHSREDGESPGADLGAQPGEEAADPMAVATAIYRSQCATCHGERGRGDGPQAALFHPPDWTTPAFQSSWSDAQLRDAITHGRNSMPPFGPTIRPEGIDLLVRLVRQYGAQGGR
jgi:mono/diheme cytochrome c family protein